MPQPDPCPLHFDNLLRGNIEQQHAHATLTSLSIFSLLRDYTPVLAGTVPLDIHTPTSDLDIICEVRDFASFEALLKQHYGLMVNFSYVYKVVSGIPRAVCSFISNGWSIEIFAEPIPTCEQNGYKHMLIEHRILKLRGYSDKEQLRMLKAEGLKTEPAFAIYYQLPEDPYEVLLDMYHWSDEQLERLLGNDTRRLNKQ